MKKFVLIDLQCINVFHVQLLQQNACPTRHLGKQRLHLPSCRKAAFGSWSCPRHSSVHSDPDTIDLWPKRAQPATLESALACPQSSEVVAALEYEAFTRLRGISYSTTHSSASQYWKDDDSESVEGKRNFNRRWLRGHTHSIGYARIRAAGPEITHVLL